MNLKIFSQTRRKSAPSKDSVLQSDCKKEEEGMTVIEFLKEEKINSSLIEGIMEFRASHPVREEDRGRIPVPRYLYYGKDVWEQAVAALLCGQNLLLTGPKATGKNILAQNTVTLCLSEDRYLRFWWRICHAFTDTGGCSRPL